ncbi:MAG: hypothetical protein JKY52_09645 [Flavobacteriales bacterium]|nr:hypothetical protein [Flavobacteriales bacterium]
MHCKACNVNLSDFESTRFNVNEEDYSEEFTDLCNSCLSYDDSEGLSVGRLDLMTDSDDTGGLPVDNLEVLMGYHDIDVLDRGYE